MILTMLDIGTTGRIQFIRGKDAVKTYLGGLGFVAGSPVSIVSENGGDLIVNVKGARVALGKQLARKIILEQTPDRAEADTRRCSHEDAFTLTAECRTLQP